MHNFAGHRFESQPGPKKLHNFFFCTDFLSFVTCNALFMPLGVFTNHVDRQGGGEVFFLPVISKTVGSVGLFLNPVQIFSVFLGFTA